ncbi:hypothetical protein [Fretibacter rubidus]|uniref:hypothetical protein n=1 Tax=Fretibacter rubidus TaxID=570162 RepID=UPI00352B6313
MTNNFNSTEFVSLETRKFTPAFEGAQSRRETQPLSLMARRNMRRDRRANRAI